MNLKSIRAICQVATLSLILLCVLGGTTAWAQMPFFPGAEGFGGTWTGSAPGAGWLSNASVYHVTNLNDDGAGSLRNAFDADTSNRIIVFDVAGTIELTSGKLDIKNVSNYHVAGQTAPGPVTIIGDTTLINASGDTHTENITLRYLTFRGSAGGDDAIGFKNGNESDPSTNMVLDHVSVSWAEDELLSVANNYTNITVQHSLIADATGGDHSYGSLVRPRVDSNVSLHHNLYANNNSRQPRLGTYDGDLLTTDVRNNVVYNWNFRATYAGGSGSGPQEQVDVNYVGNYLIAGPWNTTSTATTAFTVDKNVNVEAYQSGNLIDPDNASGGISDNNLDGTNTGWGMFDVPIKSPQGVLVQKATPISMAPVTTQSATDAYNDIIDHVGNSRWGRDAIDDRIVGNVQNFTAPPNGPEANAPIASELSSVVNAPQINHPGGWDADNDGMQDAWETEHGGNLVWNADFDNDGYINLVEYINERGEFPATAPIDFNGATSDRYALISNWKTNDGGLSDGTNWQPSKFDLARINSGTVVVDAVGQDAGTLQVAPNPADNATLSVTSGWIDVADTLEVGSISGAGTLSIASGATVFATTVEIGVMGILDGSGDIVGDILNGGLVSPGTSPGLLTVDGDYTQDGSGTLQMELDSLASFDQLDVSGTLTGGGTLEISLGFTPQAGDSWDLFDFNSATGSWLLTPPSPGAGLAWDTDDLFTTGVLSVVSSSLVENADFNDDGMVDGRDFLIWQRGFNAAGGLVDGDANDNGFVDAEDLAIWENQYGTTGLLVAASTAVPEPGSLILASGGLLLLVTRRSNRSRRTVRRTET